MEDSEDVKRLYAVGATKLPRFPGKFESSETMKQIVFENQPQSDADFAIVEKFPNLEMLQVQSGKITDVGMASLAKLKRLRDFWMTSTAVTDEGIVHLKDLVEMEKLILAGLPISDEATKNLDKMSKLKLLSFEACGGITDASVERLEKLTTLQSLFVNRTGVTPEGVQRLKTALPNCRVVDK